MYPNCIAFRAGKQDKRPSEVGALAQVFEKSATEFQLQTKHNYFDRNTWNHLTLNK